MTIYTDFGAIKGAKPGDYLVITRGYAPEDLNRIDRASEDLPRGVDHTAVNRAKVPPDSDRLMPDHVLGEILVLNVSPDSSTALITRASAEMGARPRCASRRRRQRRRAAPGRAPESQSHRHPPG